jgi:GNAT superfamily N-acetyltransferase
LRAICDGTKRNIAWLIYNVRELIFVNPIVTIEPLAAHREAIPLLQRWFAAEWPSYYGANGPGDAWHDLQSFANVGSLPVGMVALRDGKVCGVAALKAESIASHRHLCPWAAAGVVEPSARGQGIGAKLLIALEEQARTLGFRRIFCGTSTAASLLQRCGWQLMERIIHDGHDLGIYSKAL